MRRLSSSRCLRSLRFAPPFSSNNGGKLLIMFCSVSVKHLSDQTSLKSSSLMLARNASSGEICFRRDWGESGLAEGKSGSALSSDVSCDGVACGSGACSTATSGCAAAGIEITGAGLSTVPLVLLLSARLDCGSLVAQLAVDGKAGRSGAGLGACWSVLPCRIIVGAADATGC